MSSTETVEAKSKQKPGQWSVRDSNARQGPRTHEVNGRPYTLHAHEPTYMEPKDAMMFLCDESFIVEKEDGRRAISLPSSEGIGGEIPKLRPDEVIAKLTELNRDALHARAARKAGGDQFKKNARTEELLEFLLENAATETHASGSGVEIDSEDMSTDEVDSLLAGG